MSMSITVEMTLVTEGKEKRVPEEPNCFELTVNGYHLYPINEIVEIKRQKDKGHIGYGEIIETRWKDDQTTCLYRLTSLQSVN